MSDIHKIALITGTSSNLGFNIAYRLLDQLPSENRVTIIVTSRTLPKAKESIAQIKKYNETVSKRKGIVDFDYCLIDFTNMISIYNAYYDLNKQYKKIDYLFLNSAQGAFDGLDWIEAIKQTFTDPIASVTYPSYKLQKIGVKSQDDMGLVFQGNVFGPYYFIHKIKNLLQNAQNLNKNGDKARIIWISSLLSKPSYLSFNDLQFLKSPISYEGSKRSIDLLHLGTYKELYEKNGIIQYLVHPGIFTSFSFFKFLNVFTYYGMLILFYLARWLGSPWHNISGYIAANAPVYVALKADPNSKDDSQFPQSIKYGSACNYKGEESIKTTEVDPSGKDDVVKNLDSLVKLWDINLKDQIKNTRQ
ncbi:hypothetical protein B5S28_g1353 [[Candida] boidinii]|uniref:Unnamed protein product n=1 Tax=Candida boidinii TaxID=5477 RepID=A0ACB5TQT6_CANBO|nr:hypothetical protein B5S28_g1353 [[Candida] boidinii]OWB61104.1 hypothetical protein B5S29_g1988 [[Candida] boidinii]OWB71398.1 hypothetical protein B5S31_g1085 [[Candida] boidinii]GME93199.1 unnamed protein product [[Candida] boidinii]